MHVYVHVSVNVCVCVCDVLSVCVCVCAWQHHRYTAVLLCWGGPSRLVPVIDTDL